MISEKYKLQGIFQIFTDESIGQIGQAYCERPGVLFWEYAEQLSLSERMQPEIRCGGTLRYR